MKILYISLLLSEMLCAMKKKEQKYTTLNQTGPVYYMKAWTEPRNAGPETELGL